MNLDPADSRTLAMLKRAREGKPLDAPPPIPTPVAPSGSSGPARKAPAFDAEPTKLAGDDYQDAFHDESTTDGGPTQSSDDARTTVQDEPGTRKPVKSSPPPPIAVAPSPPRPTAPPPPPPKRAV